MRTIENWDTIISGYYDFQAKLRVTGNGTTTEYTTISAPQINRSLASSPISIGNVNTATLEVSILTTDEIPKGAMVEVLARVVNDNLASEWVPYGTFWVDSRQNNYQGLVTLKCFDALLRANQVFNYTTEELLTPKQMADVVEDVASRIGVDIALDSKEIITDPTEVPEGYVYKYAMLVPTDMTMTEALGYIGQVNGGNWIVTEGNELKLVPLVTDYFETEDNTTDTVKAVLGQYRYGAPMTVSGVRMKNNANEEFFYGDDSGFVIELNNPFAIDTYASSLYQQFNGLLCKPFSVSKAVINPLLELGDSLNVAGLKSHPISMRLNLDLSFRAEINSPEGNTESEYPFASQYIKILNDVKRAVDKQLTELDDSVNGAEGVRQTLIQLVATLNSLSINFTNSQSELESYIRFTDGQIVLGETTSPIKLVLDNNRLSFYDDSSEVAWFTDKALHVKDLEIEQNLVLGDFYWVPEKNRQGKYSLSLIYKGD